MTKKVTVDGISITYKIEEGQEVTEEELKRFFSLAFLKISP